MKPRGMPGDVSAKLVTAMEDPELFMVLQAFVDAIDVRRGPREFESMYLSAVAARTPRMLDKIARTVGAA